MYKNIAYVFVDNVFVLTPYVIVILPFDAFTIFKNLFIVGVGNV